MSANRCDFCRVSIDYGVKYYRTLYGPYDCACEQCYNGGRLEDEGTFRLAFMEIDGNHAEFVKLEMKDYCLIEAGVEESKYWKDGKRVSSDSE